MFEFFEDFYKFLDLEIKRGFDNKAILGGMSSIVNLWESKAIENKVSIQDINNIKTILMNYESLNKENRKDSIYKMRSLFLKYSNPQNAHINLNLLKQKTSDQIKTKIPSPYLEKFGFNAPLTTVNGIGSATAKTLAKLGILTIIDLLHYYPRRYDDYSKLKSVNSLVFGEEVTIIGTIHSISMRCSRNRNLKIVESVVGDGTGFIIVNWFNQPWLLKQLFAGKQISLSGKIDVYRGRLVLTNPDWDFLDKDLLHTNRIVPVYHLSQGISQKWLRKIIYATTNFWTKKVQDYLPQSIRQTESLVELSQALKNIHFPDSTKSLDEARTRLAFDEIFFLQLGVLKQKRNWQNARSHAFEINENILRDKLNSLPYKLTNSQEKALLDIRRDLKSGYQMNRLLQGDVGSGKTVIASLAVEIIVLQGAQAAFIAPTSILAEQHFKYLSKMLVNDDNLIKKDEVALLIGDTPEKIKKSIRENILSGHIKVVIGTHALLEDPIQFKNLQLVIIDEQHRFGVTQRALIRSKGNNPHLLVMSATPIPRSLALTIYGDLDLSIIDEMPVGRLPILTHIIHPFDHDRAYEMVTSQIEQGHQAFIVYPLIESDDDVNNQAAVNEHAKLSRKIFPKYKIGLIHGRLKQPQKEKIMLDFKERKLDILVSTTVIEVGLDIPNATIVLIEGANKFGLAQLHQIRGRVGRSEHQSYCILIPDNESNSENERLSIMSSTTDGFKLAEFDLKFRGPGEFLGTRQSGYSGLKLASLTDMDLIEKARRHAQLLFADDPYLIKNENIPLKQEITNYWPEGIGDIS